VKAACGHRQTEAIQAAGAERQEAVFRFTAGPSGSVKNTASPPHINADLPPRQRYRGSIDAPTYEMNVLDFFTVHPGFGFGQFLEDRQSALLHGSARALPFFICRYRSGGGAAAGFRMGRSPV